MATSGRVKGWRELLASNNIIPVAFDRQNTQSEINTPFSLNIKVVDGVIPQNESSITDYRVQVTLYDVAYKQFFGRTWVGPTISMKPHSHPFELPYDQHIYFHTSLNDPSIAIVVEIVATTGAPSEPRLEVSCGWGLFHLFRYKGDMPDTSNMAAVPSQRMDIFHGSPRMLFYLDEPILENTVLTSINGCQLVYTIRTHNYLQRVVHLIPENALIGANDTLPGVAEAFRSGKSPGQVDNLRKPRLLKPVSCYLERITISLSPNAEQFESELCHIMNEERIAQEGLRPDGRQLEIVKRYLQIGVHNGWTYVAEPEIVQLTVDSGDGKGSLSASFRRSSVNKRSSRRMTSAGLSGVNKSSVLVHKTRTHLEGMVEDPMFTVVFTLIYELGEPRVSGDRTSSMTRSSFTVIVRWAAFSPLSHYDRPDHTLELIGGSLRNPENSLVFYCQSDDAVASSTNLAGLTGGSLSFAFSSSKPPEPPTEDLKMNSYEAPMPEMSTLSAVNETVQRVTNAELFSQPTPKSQKRRSVVQAETHATQSTQPPSLPAYSSQPQAYHVPPASAPQGYVPIAIQHVSNSAAVSYFGWPPGTARTSSDLHEVPFAPTHIPIMPAAPGLHSGIGLPRSAYARLAAAGFPHILDRNGEPPEVIDPGDPIEFEMGKEERDRLPANEIILQFLAFSRMQTFALEDGGKRPATVFFTFQFYRFPQVTSERLFLGNVEGEISSNPSAFPCVLQRLDKDGSLMKGHPGYQVKYHIDPAFLKPGEGRLFLEHLSDQILHVDVWDGDSLMLIGSSTVELKHLCRQGLEAIQLTYELDVLINEYCHEESVLPSGRMSRDGTFCPPEAKPLLKGRLHLRMANIGYASEGKHIKTGAVSIKPAVIVKNDLDSSHFVGGGLSSPSGNLAGLLKSHSNIAKHLVETNYEVASLLSTRKDKISSGKMEGNAEQKRKLARMQRIRQLDSIKNVPMLSSFRKQKEERSRDLRTIQLYRDQSKNEGILSMLTQAITTKHSIHPSFGTAQFFEYVLKNPYNTEHTIVVNCEDPELIVITDPREWRHFRTLNAVYASIEEGMFNMDATSGKPEIFLRPKESVNVPFKFVTFKADEKVQLQEPVDPHKEKQRQGFAVKKDKGSLQSRLIKVFFDTRDKRPVSILAVSVEPQPHVIHQAFRFHHPEQSFIKKSIRFMQTQHVPGLPISVGDPSAQKQIFVRCSDTNVICNSRSTDPGESHDIFLKVACGASPQIKRFYVAVYCDPYLSKPVQIWQFYVHALQRVDVMCAEGETTQFTLVVRGTQTTRLVQCFSSHPSEMQLQPTEPFVLAANTVHEINTAIRPRRAGTKFLFLNVVDVESHQLLRSWLVCAAAKPPHIEKAFELELPVGGGRGCNKRISYTNPYPVRRVFHVHTNHPQLLQFKDSRLELEGGETQSIAMKFAPYMSRDVLEILVYINDDNDKTEETFCVKAVYK